MTMQGPFCPHRGANFEAAVTGTFTDFPIDPVAKSVRIVNPDSANYLFVRISNSAAPAGANPFTETPVLPKTAVILAKNDGDDTISIIAGGGNINCWVQTGEGGI